ncbi:MAG: 30S ribosomal protein S27ae [archaeon]
MNAVYENGKAKRKSCPKCGSGVFMGEHKNRTSCGKCGYTEFKK